jgi:integrase
VDHLLLLQKSVPIRQLAAEYMAEKANDTELSATYHSDLRLRFGRFCRTFGETGTREITAQQIKEWLWSLKTPEGRPQSAQSKKNFKTRLVALFSYGIQRGWMDTNLCEYIEIKVKGCRKEIFSVDELRSVLAHMDVVALPAFLIGVFAGVRTAERQRMTLEDIDIPRGCVTVKKHKAKTAQARTIRMEPCLKAWLLPFHGKTGPIFDGSATLFQLYVRAACKAAGMKGAPKNGCRHSFATFHVAKYEDAEKLRAIMGHMSAGMLFANYRVEGVQQEEGERYFNIFPPAPVPNVVPMDVAA